MRLANCRCFATPFRAGPVELGAALGREPGMEIS
jgi:hypothetical protein